MNELQKRFEEETGESSTVDTTDYMLFYRYSYVEWLEAQLTWRSVGELPEKGDMYLCNLQYLNGLSVVNYKFMLDYYDNTREFHQTGDKITHWLPIPKLDG